jgi:transposase
MPDSQQPRPPTYDELAALVATQAARIVELEALVVELRRRLRADSSTSHRPPSSDGPRKPPRPAVPREPGARRPGKQPGSPGAYLAQVAEPDEVVVHRPDRCGGCGAGLVGVPVTGTQTRQVFDLPEVGLWVVEHRAEQRRCGCGHPTTAAFPPEARAAACYGPRVRAVGCYLLAAQHLPVDRAAQVLAEVVGAPMATGTLAGLVGEAAAGLDDFMATARELVAAAPVAHFDETGARIAGRGHWVHSASTATVSVYAAHPRRGREAMDAAGILGGFGGVAVHDGWAPYRHYQAATHALCNAHHLRELDAVAAEAGQGWAGELAEWLTIARTTATGARQAGAGAVDPAAMAGLLDGYGQIIAKGRAANPPPARPPGHRGRVKRTPAANLLQRLDTYRDQVYRFLTDLRVPFTNNQAEQDIRMVKLQQKISGCWRTLPGAQAWLTVRSYLATARKHGHTPLAALDQLFAGRPWLPAPP